MEFHSLDQDLSMKIQRDLLFLEVRLYSSFSVSITSKLWITNSTENGETK